MKIVFKDHRLKQYITTETAWESTVVKSIKYLFKL